MSSAARPEKLEKAKKFGVTVRRSSGAVVESAKGRLAR
jgi:hypothetical protein